MLKTMLLLDGGCIIGMSIMGVIVGIGLRKGILKDFYIYTLGLITSVLSLISVVLNSAILLYGIMYFMGFLYKAFE